ncbi:MAG: P1 family peptidase [Firmicutes bacterium]|nr:P1 family peptidase [Bacillota bacterium]
MNLKNIKDINQFNTDFLFGHAENKEARTGVTVIISKDGATAGYDTRGGSFNLRIPSAVNPEGRGRKLTGVVLAGGSGFGHAASDGVMQYLSENKVGGKFDDVYIPSVASAILFDLAIGDSNVRPDPAMGRVACEHAFARKKFVQGSFGAGTGALIGKARGEKYASQGGQGAHIIWNDGVYVGAITAVNASGDILGPDGQIVHGALNDDMETFADSRRIILERAHLGNKRKRDQDRFAEFEGDDLVERNTTISCIFTNAILTKPETRKIAEHANDGIARVVNVPFAGADGDTVFAMASNKVDVNAESIGIMAADAMAHAIWNAVEAVKLEQAIKEGRELR